MRQASIHNRPDRISERVIERLTIGNRSLIRSNPAQSVTWKCPLKEQPALKSLSSLSLRYMTRPTLLPDLASWTYYRPTRTFAILVVNTPGCMDKDCWSNHSYDSRELCNETVCRCVHIAGSRFTRGGIALWVSLSSNQQASRERDTPRLDG